MNHQPNIIKVAITAAGGRDEAAKAVGADRSTLSRWVRLGWMPPEKIRPLCDAGSGVVKPEQILAYIEAAKASEKVAA